MRLPSCSFLESCHWPPPIPNLASPDFSRGYSPLATQTEFAPLKRPKERDALQTECSQRDQSRGLVKAPIPGPSPELAELGGRVEAGQRRDWESSRNLRNRFGRCPMTGACDDDDEAIGPSCRGQQREKNWLWRG